jgi:hypothetical protein
MWGIMAFFPENPARIGFYSLKKGVFRYEEQFGWLPKNCPAV